MSHNRWKRACEMKPGERGYCSEGAYYTSCAVRIDALDMETGLFVDPNARVFNQRTGHATLYLERRLHGFVMVPPSRLVDRPSSHYNACLPITNVKTWMDVFRAAF
jgi:hypothetical protein